MANLAKIKDKVLKIYDDSFKHEFRKDNFILREVDKTNTFFLEYKNLQGKVQTSNEFFYHDKLPFDQEQLRRFMTRIYHPEKIKQETTKADQDKKPPNGSNLNYGNNSKQNQNKILDCGFYE